MTLYLDTCHRQISIWTRSTVNLDTFGHIKRQTHLGCWRVASWKGISCSTNQKTLDCKIQPSDWLNTMSLSQPTINRVFLLIWSISIPAGVNIPFPLGSERYCRKGGKWTILMMEQHSTHIGANASFFIYYFISLVNNHVALDAWLLDCDFCFIVTTVPLLQSGDYLLPTRLHISTLKYD